MQTILKNTMKNLANKSKWLIIIFLLFITLSCNGQNEIKEGAKLQETTIHSDESNNTQDCYDTNNDLFKVSIKESHNKKRSICLTIDEEINLCNDNLLYADGELGAISSDGENISIDCSKGKVNIVQEYGGGSSLGAYSFEIKATKQPIIDSISMSEKVFLDEEVKVISKGVRVNIPFNNNSDLTDEFESLTQTLFTDKNKLLVNYIEDKSKDANYEWSIESINLLEYLLIDKGNLERVNNIAFQLEQTQKFDEAIILLEKIIDEDPNRVVAYLNIADAYWSINSQNKAKKAYHKYVELMEKQNKDINKIPKRVYQRLDK